MPPFDYDTVLCDVDGTLIDSNDAHAQTWTTALREAGVGVESDEVRSLIGMGGDKLLPRVAQIDEDSPQGRAIGKRKKALFNALLPTLEATPGSRDLLQYLRACGVNLVVATSADDEEVGALLKQAGVDDLLRQRTSKDDAQGSKPDPDIVHAALAKARATPARTLMIGDTPYDIEAARRAGVACVAFRCGGFWHDHDLAGAVSIEDDPRAWLATLRATSRYR